jgi:hypothetical protein
VMMMLILITASNCSTAPEAISPPLLILSFPEFPDPLDGEGNTIPVLEGGIVRIPLWYWLRITEYTVDVERVRQEYKAWKMLE